MKLSDLKQDLKESKPNHFVLNEDTIKGRWKEFRGGVQKLWGKVTDDDLDQAKGDLLALSGIIQRRYGESKEAVHKKLNDHFDEVWNDASPEVGKGAEQVKEAMAEAAESAKQKL